MSQQYPPPAQTPKKRRRWPWIVGGLLLAVIIISAVSGGGDDAEPDPATAAAPVAPPVANAPAAPAPAEPAAEGDVIRYEVEGDGVDEAGNITYVADENFSQQQANGESLPWSTEITLPNGVFDFQPLSLVAQSGSQDGGDITCRILRNGEVIVESTSSGAFAVVTCSGT